MDAGPDNATQSPPPPPVPARRRSVQRRVMLWAFWIFAPLVILMALALGALRVALAQVPEYREQIQAWVNDTSRLDIRFDKLDARWRVFGPEIYVTDAQVFAPNGGPLLARARAASIGVDLGRILLRAELLSGRIRLIEPEISLVRTQDGRVELEGQAALDARDRSRFNVDDLPTGLLQIVDARLRFRDVRNQLGALRLDGVDMTLERDRNDVSVEGEVQLPKALGRTLEFSGAAEGRLSEAQELNWTVEVDARALELAGWREFFGTLLQAPSAGQGDLYARVHFKGAHLDAGAARLNFRNVVLTGVQPGTVARYSTIAGNFEYSDRDGERRLSGEKVDLSTVEHAWEPTSASIAWAMNDTVVASVEAQAGFLQLENLLLVVTIAPQAPWRERALGIAPRGQVRSLRASYRAEADQRELTAGARLIGVGFRPYERLPGVTGLNGQLSVTPQSGQLNIDSTGLTFSLPQVFREPLRANLARGQLTWSRGEDAWRIATREFLVRNPDINAATDADITLPLDSEQSPVLKLHSRFTDVQLTSGWRYLPVNKLKGKTLEWLDAAFLAGEVPSGEFVFDGPTRQFPFRDGGGEFRVTFPVQGLKLHYAAGWPDAEGVAADIEFKNQGLTGQLRAGTVNGLRLLEGTAQFADFKTGELTVKARADGDIGDALGYVQQAPIGEALGGLFMGLRGRGKSAVEVDLLLPVKNIEDRRVEVLAQLDEASLTLEGTRHAMQSVAGKVRVLDREVSFPDGLTGTYLGGPARVDAAPEISAGRTDNVVRVRATTPAPALALATGTPAVVGLGGVVDWRGVLRLPIDNGGPRRAARVPSLRVESSLRGTSIGLPEPFAKAAATTQVLRAEVVWPAPAEAVVRAAYGSIARAQLRIVERDKSWQFARGTLRFGEIEPGLPAADGLELRGSLDALDLSAWFGLGDRAATSGARTAAAGSSAASASPVAPAASRASGNAGRALSDYLRSADLSVGELSVFGLEFPDVNARLLAGPSSWSVNVDSPKARGLILVPFDFGGSEPLLLNLSSLSIGDAEALAQSLAAAEEQAPVAAEQEPDPRAWPSVRASIGQFEAWGKRLGFVRAELVRIPEGLRLASFTVQSHSFAASGEGSWTMQAGMGRGALKLKLESTDVQQTLLDLGYGAALTGERGLVEANVRWNGAPDATLADRLAGTIHLEVDDGQLVNVQPGAGRVFGLMSVAALPRRLSLDFSDFLKKGLGYDSIRGDFELRDGDAHTTNLLLKGPAAEIGIVGRTGLRNRDYDQTAVVTGSVGNTLPVVGALAGGPVVGAAVLLFSQVFKEPLKGIARGYYRITGPWDDPTVVRMDRAEGKKAEDDVRTAEGAS